MKISQSYLFYKDQLKGEFAEAFDRVELYCMAHEFEDDYMEERLMSLLDMMMEAQTKGETPGKIVGADVDVFCEHYFSDYSMKERAVGFIKCVGRLAWGIILIGIFEMVMERPTSLSELIHMKSDMGAFIAGILAAGVASFLIDAIVKHFFHRKLPMTNKMRNRGGIALIVLFDVLALWLFPEEVFVYPVFPVMVIAALYIASYYVGRAILRYLDHGDFKSVRDHVEGEKKGKAFLDSVCEQIPAQTLKQYQKMNARRLSRGKPELTREEYMEKWVKEGTILKYEPYILGALCFAFILTEIVKMTKGFTPSDTVMFAVIMLVFQIPAILILAMTAQAYQARMRMIALCKARGTDVITYAIEQEKASESM